MSMHVIQFPNMETYMSSSNEITSTATRITIVDDETHLRETVSFSLQQQGFKVSAFPDGRTAWKNISKTLPDLVVLDIMMPLMDGLELCRRIRGISEELPVIFLTSRDDEFDKVLGLELGADDYLCKPFSTKELIARIRALLRRAKKTISETKNQNSNFNNNIYVPPLELAVDSFRLKLDGSEIKLTVTECRLLESLMDSPGVVKSRTQLLHTAFPDDAYLEERSVDTHIKRIRKKISHLSADLDPIETVYGAGYLYKRNTQ